MFAPLAYTKTYGGLGWIGHYLDPVLMGYFIRGKVLPEHKNPVNRLLVAIYTPILRQVLRFPKFTLLGAVVVTVVGFIPL